MLNASYEPLGTVAARRAVVLVLGEKADCVHPTGLVLHAERLEVPVPSVVRLRQFVHVPFRRRVSVSRRAVMARDGHRCQYCGAHADSHRPRRAPQPRRRCTRGTTSSPPAARATSASATACSRTRACGSSGAPVDAARHRVVDRRGRSVPDDWLTYLGEPTLVAGARRRGMTGGWPVEHATGSAAGVPRPAARPRRGAVGARLAGRAPGARARARPSATTSSTAPPARRPASRWSGAARGGGAVLLEPATRSGSTSSCPGPTRCWHDDVGRAAWWLGERWAAALAALGIAGRQVHRGGLVRHRVVGPGVLRRARPRRGDRRRAARWWASASAAPGPAPGSSAPCRCAGTSPAWPACSPLDAGRAPTAWSATSTPPSRPSSRRPTRGRGASWPTARLTERLFA